MLFAPPGGQEAGQAPETLPRPDGEAGEPQPAGAGTLGSAITSLGNPRFARIGQDSSFQ